MKKALNLTIAFLVLSLTVKAQNALLTNPITGNPTASAPIYDFEFVYNGTDLVLVTGSYNTGRLYAIDFNHSNSIGVTNWSNQSVTQIISKVSTQSGISSTNLSIRDMEVNPKTKAVYLLMLNSSNNLTFLVEVKSAANINIINLNNSRYSSINYTNNNNFILDMEWAGNGKLYYSSGDFTLASEIGELTPPFLHNANATLHKTTMFKTNWGGGYFTNAPLERISYTKINGVDRLTGVTTCAPGFSIPLTSFSSSTSLLQVTEDFNVHFYSPIKVVTCTQMVNGIEQSYLFDLHRHASNAALNPLIRVGRKFLDGSQVTDNKFNATSQLLRNNTGNIVANVSGEEASIIATGYKMITKYDEGNLIVVDNQNTLKLYSVFGNTNSIITPKVVNKLFINPTLANEYIEIKQSTIQEDATYEIRDMMGTIIYTGKETQKRINVSDFKSGIYVVSQLHNNKIVATSKFVISR